MKPNTTPPSIGQWMLVLFLAAASLVCGGISITLNWTFGIEISLFAAIIFAAFGCLEILIPFVAKSGNGWTMRYRAAWLVCLAVSVLTAGSHLLRDQAQKVKDQQAQTATVAGARVDQDRVRADLNKITETMSVQALADLVKAAKAKTAEMETAARQAGVACAVQKRCVAAQAEQTKYLERLGQAQAKEDLTRQLKATAPTAATAEKSIGMADSLAAVSGYDRAKIAYWLGLVVVALQILGLELAITFSGDVGERLAGLIAARKAARPTTKPRAAQPAREEPRQDPGETGTTKEKALFLTQSLIWMSEGQQTSKGIRALAEKFGVPKSTYAEWMKDWIGQGLILKIEINGKTMLRAPRKAA